MHLLIRHPVDMDHYQPTHMQGGHVDQAPDTTTVSLVELLDWLLYEIHDELTHLNSWLAPAGRDEPAPRSG
jgi:hypothetical protein